MELGIWIGNVWSCVIRVAIFATLLAAAVQGCDAAGSHQSRTANTEEPFPTGSLALLEIASGPSSAWEVAATPTVVIGSGEAGDLYQVRGAVILATGSLVVADGGSGQLRLYGREGQLLRVLGRRGEGPGEFRRLSGVWKFEGDSLLALDTSFGQHRFLVFSPGGDFVRSWSPLTPPGESRTLGVAAVASDGAVLFLTSTTIRPAEVPVLGRNLESAYWYKSDGDLAGSLGRFPGPLIYRGSGMQQGRVSFGAGTLFAATGLWWFSFDPISGDIRKHRRDGTVELVFRMEVPRAPITEAHKSKERERRKAELREGLRGAVGPMQRLLVEQEAMVEEMPFPERFPPYARVFGGSDGCLWVQVYPPLEDGGERWQVLAPSGQWLARVTLPYGLTLYDVAADNVVVVRRDELGTEYVQVHGLERSTTCR